MYSLLLEWFKTHYNHQLFLFVRSRAAHISVVVCFFCIGVKTSAEFVCFSERERISIEVYNFGGGQCTFYLIARMARNIVVFKFKQNPCFFRSFFFLFVAKFSAWCSLIINGKNWFFPEILFHGIRKQSIIIWISLHSFFI